MKVFLCFPTRRFAILFVLLLAEASARSLVAQPKGTSDEIVVLQQDMFVAQPKGTSDEIVVLQQDMFAPLSKHDVPIFERINVESLDGKPISFDQLPAKANEKLASLELRVCPHLELNDADPRDAIRIIIRKPKPRQMIRLGLIAEPKAQEVDPSWMTDLSFGQKRLSCVATNVSLLDLSIVLAEAFECEFGVTADGQAEFRNKKSAAGHIRQPLYVVKSKPVGYKNSSDGK